mgnify:CR=1 FL=1
MQCRLSSTIFELHFIVFIVQEQVYQIMVCLWETVLASKFVMVQNMVRTAKCDQMCVLFGGKVL